MAVVMRSPELQTQDSNFFIYDQSPGSTGNFTTWQKLKNQQRKHVISFTIIQASVKDNPMPALKKKAAKKK